ncbi:hypothetical protein [Moorena sp. SIO4E2]|uniref:hypothetical protein n=1 Tax=Moorena sp. SIO4E2 TaxID=2607826 RepID=UPI00257E64EA|nr:hypothetical protein [Moorena sp. SIO4E2]
MSIAIGILYCLLPIAYCLLPIAYCLLPIASCLLPARSAINLIVSDYLNYSTTFILS